MIDHIKQTDLEIIQKELQLSETNAERSIKRKEIAKRRKKLGFNDEADEMDDKELEHYEFKVKTYTKNIDQD